MAQENGLMLAKRILNQFPTQKGVILSGYELPVYRKEAKQLFMSERTISNHLQNIYEKLQVSSTIEAVTKAIQMGYIEPMY